MRFKNVFCTQLYKDTFSKVLKEDEFTHGDEILVDMEAVSYTHLTLPTTSRV